MATTFLFVPGDRPDRFAKAGAAGADVVIVDLEDAVAAGAKDAARSAALEHLRGGARVALRINNDPTGDQRGADVELLRAAAAADAPPLAVIVPRCATPDSLTGVAAAAGGVELIALVESAAGLLALRDLAPHCARLALGHLDLAADLGCAVDADLIRHARSQLVLHSRAAGLPAPVDGVTPDVRDPGATRRDASYARREGFGGKLCLHPDQVAAVREAMRPTQAELAWAGRVRDALREDGVAVVDGEMVDAPVLARASALLARA